MGRLGSAGPGPRGRPADGGGSARPREYHTVEPDSRARRLRGPTLTLASPHPSAVRQLRTGGPDRTTDLNQPDRNEIDDHRDTARVSAGETRVAATPQTVGQLIKLGYEVVVESGAGAAASFSDEAFAEAGADIGSPDQVLAADVVLKVNAPDREEIAALRDGATLVSLIVAGAEPGPRRAAGRPADHGAGDGRGAAHLAGAVAGRAVLDGQHRRLPRRDRGRARVRPVLHRAGDRGGQGAAGQGAGRRRGRGRSGGDRRGGQPGRDRAGHRPAARGRRPGQVAGWGVPVDRVAGGRGQSATGYAKEMGDDYKAREARALRRAGRGRRHHHHHRADPRPAGAAAHHRRHGGLDEVRQRDRRHGRGQRRQRRGHRRRTRRSSPTTA